MLTGKKAVIFDLDGTLINSMSMWDDINVEYLSKFGLSVPENLQREISGMSFTECAIYFKEKFQLPVSVDEIKDVWNEMAMYKYIHEVPLKTGVVEFLTELKRRGIKTGIATSNSIELVEAVLDSLQIAKYFDEVHTSCEVQKGKPAPDIYLFVAKCLSVAPEECLVFEDVPEGIIAGKRAGMQVCAVEDDFSNYMIEEKKKLADYYIVDYAKLL